jgi:hypothetical protein
LHLAGKAFIVRGMQLLRHGQFALIDASFLLAGLLLRLRR